MGDVINLNRARKAKARVEKSTRAVENRIRFGLTKEQKAADRAAREKAARDLDGFKRD